MVLFAAVILFTQCKKKEVVEKTTITGQVLNSQTGLGLGSAKVSFCQPFVHGVSSTTTVTPKVVFFVTTDASGNFTTNQAVVGSYTLMIEATNYFTLFVDNFNVTSGLTNTFQPITLVQTLSGSVLRIVLNWGASPLDLDSHLTGPIASSASRFHVYFMSEFYTPAGASGPSVILDVDDVTSYGPETTTINSWQAGTYRYSIFNYSDPSIAGGAGIKSSPAAVNVYGSTGIIKSYSPPAFTANGGNTWVVFEITVASNGTYIITDKNTWINSTDSGSVTKK